VFDIGFSELLVVFVVGLLILGPERLPHAAKTAGLWIRKIRRSINSVQREINAQLDNEEMQQKIAETNKRMLQEGQAIQNTITPLAVSQTEPKPVPVATAQHTDQVDAADLTESPEAITDTDTKAKQDTKSSD